MHKRIARFLNTGFELAHLQHLPVGAFADEAIWLRAFVFTPTAERLAVALLTSISARQDCLLAVPKWLANGKRPTALVSR